MARRRRRGAVRPTWMLTLVTLLTLAAGGVASGRVTQVEQARPELTVAANLTTSELVVPVPGAAEPGGGLSPSAPDGPVRLLASGSPAPVVAADARRDPPPAPSASPEDALLAAPVPANADPAPWAVSARETGLWSGPDGGQLFTRVPAGATFRVLEQGGARFRVYYPGDRATRRPGEAWVDRGDLTEATWPRLVRLRTPARMRSAPLDEAAVIADIPAGEYVEVLGDVRGRWARVFSLGDGRRPPSAGWLDVGPAVPTADPSAALRFLLTRETVDAGPPSPWLTVPYRSQLDGMPYAEANCGPTTANMVLEAFGFQVPQAALRREVLALQPAEDCDDCGTYIQSLVEVIARRGLKTTKLHDEPEDFHRWTLEEIRAELRGGRPVVAQVYFRRLPGREAANYYGDHYVVLTGLLGDRFVYNDSIDSDGGGYGRLITAQALDAAMRESDFPYAAFSVGR